MSPVRRHQEGQRADGPHLRHLYGLPTTGLRFFTVYGPWGRPDMALFLFTRAILAGEPIDVFNHGDDAPRLHLHRRHRRGRGPGDRPTRPNPTRPGPATLPTRAPARAPYRVYNIGNNQPVELMRFIEVLEDCLGMKADKNMLPMQPGDVPATYADVDDLTDAVGFPPSTPLEIGIARFVEWYRTTIRFEFRISDFGFRIYERDGG